MSYEIFTEAWARAWSDQLLQSERYREAAASWEGSLIFEMAADPRRNVPEDRVVYLDLWRGECRAARLASTADRDAADYVIRAKAKVWRRILDGKLEPLFGLMSGRLKLTRGSLTRLTPYAKAAREMLDAAARIGGHFPGDGPPASKVVVVPVTEAEPENGEMPVGPPEGPRRYQTTSARGLDHRLPPMRLWHKAKKVGIWDPRDIDFSGDARDWQGLNELEREVILHLSSLFQAGEESVTLDLLPLIQVIAGEGRLEEEMFLTAFLWEEAKHVEVFRRFLDEVAGDRSDLSRFHAKAYQAIFYDELPRAMARLKTDPSPVAQAEASVIYNMIVEGVLAETGYHAYHAILERNDLMPGMRQAVAYLKSDEARHLAYGVFLLSRLVAEHGDAVWEPIEKRMGHLLPIALELIDEMFAAYEEMAFGLVVEEFTDFAMSQFQRRLARIEKARHQSLDEVCRISLGVEDEAGPTGVVSSR